jgi:hypothetical protein
MHEFVVAFGGGGGRFVFVFFVEIDFIHDWLNNGFKNSRTRVEFLAITSARRAVESIWDFSLLQVGLLNLSLC